MPKALSLWPAIGQYEKMPATGVPLAEHVASDVVLFGPVLNPGATAGSGVFGGHGYFLGYFLFSSINRRTSSCTHQVWHQGQKSASSPGICPGWSH